jgi:polar amino acid transport system substrate-binding protein
MLCATERCSQKVLNRLFIFLACGLLLGAASPVAASPAAHEDISLCGDIWCPYNCAPGAPKPGFVLEIAQEVFAQAGYHLSYQVTSWARCVEDARAGRYTGILAAIRGDAPDFTFPQQAVGVSSSGFAVRKGDPYRYTGVRSFDGRLLGTVRGYSYNGEIGAYIVAHADDGKRVAFVSGNEALQKNLNKLIAGRVDLVLDDEIVLRSTVASLGLNSQISVVHGHSALPVFIAFSPATPDRDDLARVLDRGIKNLRATGGMAALLARYHVQDGS